MEGGPGAVQGGVGAFASASSGEGSAMHGEPGAGIVEAGAPAVRWEGRDGAVHAGAGAAGDVGAASVEGGAGEEVVSDAFAGERAMTGAFAADVVAVGEAWPGPEPVEIPEAGSSERPLFGYRHAGPPGAGLIPPMKLRRLGRTQALALAAATRAVSSLPAPIGPPEAVAVAAGTALGELDETVGFLENMIRLEEREPKPARFINSVHNALAAQIAISFGWKGENHTFVHNALSFESALWQALYLLHDRRADHVLACGVDGLNPYAVRVGRELGCYRSGSMPLAPLQRETGPRTLAGDGCAGLEAGTPLGDGAAGLEAGTLAGDGCAGLDAGTLAGEGAAAFLLTRPGAPPRLARIAAVTARPAAFRHPREVDAGRELAFIERVLVGAGGRLEQIPYILLGANGDPDLDGAYRRVMEAVSARASAPPVFGVYKQRCGELCTASALGLALAVRAVHEGRLPLEVQRLEPVGDERPVSSILLFHMAPAGFHSVVWVTP
jgi:3-oxoacyl-(acyl-carrier-protein) synthase